MTSRLTMTSGDWLLLILLSVMWGCAFFFGQVGLREIPPLTMALGRVGIAAILLGLYVWALGLALPKSFAVWRSLAFLGVINNALPFALIFWSQTHIPGGLASILNATTPLFTIILAHFMTTDERLTPQRMTGLIVGFIGVVVLIGFDALRDLGLHVLAQLASLAGAFAYAYSGVYARRLRGEQPAVIAAGMLGFATLWLLPVVALVERPWELPPPSLTAWASVISVATISTAFAYLIYLRILARAGATNLLLVTFLIPVSAILLNSLILGETLEARHFAGMGAIAIGLAAIDGRPYRWLRGMVAATPSRA